MFLKRLSFRNLSQVTSYEGLLYLRLEKKGNQQLVITKNIFIQ